MAVLDFPSIGEGPCLSVRLGRRRHGGDFGWRATGFRAPFGGTGWFGGTPLGGFRPTLVLGFPGGFDQGRREHGDVQQRIQYGWIGHAWLGAKDSVL